MNSSKYYQGTAKVKFYSEYCVAYINGELDDYYRSLIPKAWYVKPQAFPAHITVVRLNREVAANNPNWKLDDGKDIKFAYETIINTDGTYFWLNAWSEDIKKIRNSLGLPDYREGFSSYHITIGNIK